jgi:dihydrofolate synthase/folylpolyglutamate synthase
VSTQRNRGQRSTSAISYLASRARFGVKFGLETIRALAEALEHPERAYPALLVAGTNGKGSVVAYVDAALRASGLRVGRYTSPHLVRVHERIAVDDRLVSDRDLEAAIRRVRHAADTLVESGAIPTHPTYFETLTAAALHHFRRAKVDVAVLEVGMGGRLDATNVVEPLASAVVSLARDHEGYLGRSLPAIAREKAGVLRRRRTTVLGPMPLSARRAIEREAHAAGARLVDAWNGAAIVARAETLDVRTRRGRYFDVRPLPGRHQRDNLLVAVRLLEAAYAAGLRFDRRMAARGLSLVRWPGRLQWVPSDPPLLLDGAHNPAGARALAAYLRRLGPFVLVFGAMADKDVAAMARRLFPMAKAIVLTRPPLDRAASPAEIARRVGTLARRARKQSDLGRALALARRLARGRPIVVAGSLYLVGETMRRLRIPAWPASS